MSACAFMKASGKQFWVEKNKVYVFNKLPLVQGDRFVLNQVLVFNKYKPVELGRPLR